MSYSYRIEDNVITYDPRYCINCSWGDEVPATHDPIGVGPKCCYDNACDLDENGECLT